MSDTSKIDAKVLADLLAKVTAATGPDREIDVGLMAGFLPHHKRTQEVGFDDLIWVPWKWNGSCWREAERIPYTASIDASLTLVEKMLPGWVWVVERREPVEPMAFRAAVYAADMSIGLEGYAQTAPLAILQSLLSALPALTQGEGKT